ncbi:MAG: hypothetical protein ACYC61_03875 [Isosphaeraceae bacterium]
MRVLRRLAGEAGMLAVLFLAVFGCYGIAAEWPRVQARSEAARPLPRLPGEVRGPTLEQAIARLSQMGPEWESPTDVVE